MQAFLNFTTSCTHWCNIYGACITTDVTGIILIGWMVYMDEYVCSWKAGVMIAGSECLWSWENIRGNYCYSKKCYRIPVGLFPPLSFPSRTSCKEVEHVSRTTWKHEALNLTMISYHYNLWQIYFYFRTDVSKFGRNKLQFLLWFVMCFNV